jgi:hypothetical protein
MTMPKRTPTRARKAHRFVRVANPLSTIAVFLGFAEVTSGIAATVTDNEIQMIFAGFSAAFPPLVLVGFGFFLWNKPESLYAPGDFPESTPIQSYIDAVRGAGRERLEAEAITLQEMVTAAVESTIVKFNPKGVEAGDEVRNLARQVASDEIGKRLVTVQLPSADEGSQSIDLPITERSYVDAFLDSIYFALKPLVRPFRYGTDWILFDLDSGKEFQNMGTAYAREHRSPRDTRLLAEVGITPGTRLAVRML